ncbi:hypothetical protein XELAEV_18007078mg [Xenopus laevis]|uniref:Secreted protein n=1 Tax=Xenopus laevis TaxID=8355 RepID=A0A974E0U3_XENLA|nr:hypothetical protein XELAEV_18007078mg [Xenopus laevis]
MWHTFTIKVRLVHLFLCFWTKTFTECPFIIWGKELFPNTSTVDAIIFSSHLKVPSFVIPIERPNLSISSLTGMISNA